MILQFNQLCDEEKRLIHVIKANLMRARLNLQQAERWKDWQGNLYTVSKEWRVFYNVLLSEARDYKSRAKKASMKYERIQGENFLSGIPTSPLSVCLGPNFRSWDEHKLTFYSRNSPSSGDSW